MIDKPYKILTSVDKLDLEYAVLQAMKDGYIPCGGVSILGDKFTTLFAQAIVLTEEMQKRF